MKDKIESVLMCAMFVLCTLGVTGALFAIMHSNIAPVQLAHSPVTTASTVSPG